MRASAGRRPLSLESAFHDGSYFTPGGIEIDTATRCAGWRATTCSCIDQASTWPATRGPVPSIPSVSEACRPATRDEGGTGRARSRPAHCHPLAASLRDRQALGRSLPLRCRRSGLCLPSRRAEWRGVAWRAAGPRHSRPPLWMPPSASMTASEWTASEWMTAPKWNGLRPIKARRGARLRGWTSLT